MELVQLDPHGRLYLSPAIDNWEPIHQVGISAINDLDGEIDHGIPTVPNQVLYIYFPIFDDDLPNLQATRAERFRPSPQRLSTRSPFSMRLAASLRT